VVRREKFLDHELVDLFALEVPHLLVAAEMRERVEGLAYLILAAHHRAGGEERDRDVVGMLRRHRARDRAGLPCGAGQAIPRRGYSTGQRLRRCRDHSVLIRWSTTSPCERMARKFASGWASSDPTSLAASSCPLSRSVAA